MARDLGEAASRCLSRLPLAALTLVTLSGLAPAQAGVQFQNCVGGAYGSITCDTVPTGNTYFNDKDSQYCLLQNASPGWNEFNPYEGYDDEFGDFGD